MKKYLPVIIIVISIIAVAGFLLSRNDKKTTSSSQATNSSENNDMAGNSTSSAQQAQTNQTTQSTSQITISNFAFSPDSTTVKVGTKVTWTNNDSAPHTVTSDSGSILNSDTLNKGDSFSFTFDQAGTYKYHCKIHPSMTAVVTVVQ
jgi:plastocyanin